MMSFGRNTCKASTPCMIRANYDFMICLQSSTRRCLIWMPTIHSKSSKLVAAPERLQELYIAGIRMLK